MISGFKIPADFRVGFYSNLMGTGVGHGYGYAAVKLIEAWQRLGVPVWGHDPTCPIAVSFVHPVWYHYDPLKPCVGYTPWESTGVPAMWDFYMNFQTELWATCEANRQWYLDAGVTRPIRVLHHGVDRQDWPLKRRHSGAVLRFLMVGATARRKGAQRAIAAFLAAFPTQLDVSLTVLGQPGFAITDSRITNITDYLSQPELTKLYLDHHVMIYPTNGEGFGEIPFHSAATGMPTLVTDWSGPHDYIRYCMPIRVAKLVKPDYYPHDGCGLWAEPDHDDLVDQLRQIYRTPEYFFQKYHRLGSLMDREFSWDVLAKKSMEWLLELAV